MAKKKAAALALMLSLDSDSDEGIERSIWVRPMFYRRSEKGCFENLLKDLKIEDPEKFHGFLRMNKETFAYVVASVKTVVMKQDTVMRLAISAEERVAVTLRFLATGDSFHSLSFMFRISPAAISLIVPEVCDAIYSELKDHIKTPRNDEDWKKVASDFYSKWNFPNCLGAIDGKHVQIIKPANSESHFFNYKGTFSMVLMAVVDSNMRFIYVDFGTNGRISDGGVWSKCTLSREIEMGQLSLPEPSKVNDRNMPFVFVADDAFPLKEYLLKPYSRNDLNNDRRIFNYRLSRARGVVEMAFGILAAKWRVYEKPLRLTIKHTKSVVMATVVLHNIIRTQGTGLVDQAEDQSSSGLQDIGRIGSNMYTKVAKETREMFSDYFLKEGRVSWQEQYMNSK